MIELILSHTLDDPSWRLAPDNREGVRILFDFGGEVESAWFQLRLSVHDPVMALKTSLVGSINVLEVAKRMRARIVHASSSKVYGLIQSGPVPEEFRGNVNPVGEHSAYEEGKRAAESLFTAYHNQYGVDTRIARLFNVYGARMALNDGKVISGFIRNALYGENITIRGNGTQTRCFLYIDDAVEALVRMMGTDGNLSKPINIGGIDPMRIDALAEDVVNLTGS